MTRTSAISTTDACTAMLRQAGSFSNADVALFEAHSVWQSMEQGDYVVKAGDMVQAVYFLQEGAAIQYRNDDNQVMLIKDLHTAGAWCMVLPALLTQQPSQVFLQAFTTCRMRVLYLNALHYLITQSAAFLYVSTLMERSTARLQLLDQLTTPIEKYKYLMQERPEILQQFPLRHIASYLNITPETLSRVRRKYIS